MEQTQRNALYYLIAAVIGKASGLILIPLYLLVLTPLEAGIWAMLGILKVVISALSTFAADGYLTQEYWHRPASERSLLAARCMNSVWRWNIKAAILIAPFAVWEPAQIWVLTCLGSQAAGIVALGLAHYRIEERARAYCAMSCLSGGGASLLAASLACGGMGVDGIAIGFALPAIVMAIWLRLSLSPASAGEPGLTNYVRQVLPSRLVAEAVGQADRIVLGCFVGPVQLGLYDLAARCAGIVGVLLSSAKQAVFPSVLKSLATGTDSTKAWATWRKAQWMSTGLVFLLIAGGWWASALNPMHPWSPSFVYLPGTLAIPFWTHAALANAAAISHHRMIRTQALLPVLTLAMVLIGTVTGGWVSPLGVAWGATGGLAATVFGVRAWLHKRGAAVTDDWQGLVLLCAATFLLGLGSLLISPT